MNKEDVMSLFEFYNNGSGSYLSQSHYNAISDVVDKIMILDKPKKKVKRGENNDSK